MNGVERVATRVPNLKPLDQHDVAQHFRPGQHRLERNDDSIA